MSIINDALKRAQKNMAKTDGKKQADKKAKPKAAEPSSTIKQAADAAKAPVYPTPISQKPKTPPPKKPSTEKAKTKKKKKQEKMWYQTLSVIVAIFFLITGILIATLYFLKQRSSQGDADGIRRNYQPKRIQRNYKPGELNLSGTSLIENRRVALINGDIYEEGEIVDGNKIISIELKKVALQDPNGKVIMLRVKKAD